MKEHKVLGGFVLALLILIAASYLFPLVFMLISSFKSNGQLMKSIWSLPSGYGFKNYEFVFANYDIARMFLNSIVLSAGGVVALVAATSVTAYVTAKFDFVGKKFVYGFAILVMLIPSIGSMSATYKLLHDIGPSWFPLRRAESPSSR